MRFNPHASYILLFTLVLLAGCGTTISGRAGHAKSLAATGQLELKHINAGSFVLTSWQKMTAPNQPIHIYIEGDGLAWLGRSQPSPNPTPRNPIALSLAARDPSPNVIYIARPCQYTPLDHAGNKACNNAAHWLSDRFSSQVVNAYMIAFDKIAQETGATEFHVTGYSGGANIAGILAAQRSDITLLRTVAGNIDNDYFTSHHKVSPMPGSLNMADKVDAIAHIPQLHFIGAEDKIVPIDIYKSYINRITSKECVRHQIISKTDHRDGWETAWPDLLKTPVTCSLTEPYGTNLRL
jgi:hypothetical protein